MSDLARTREESETLLNLFILPDIAAEAKQKSDAYAPASTSLMTRPWTSVNRLRMPLWYQVSLS